MLNTLKVIFNTRHKIDVCVDRTRPALVAETTQLKQALVSTKTKRIRVRYLTEITNDNLYYCKELLSIVDELRHLEGIRANFYVSENEYAAPESFHEKGKQAHMMIYSDIKEVVQHQQHIFESIWNASTSAENKIEEIEGNIKSGTTEIIDNPSKTKALFIDLVKSAKFEILLILPTVNAFLRDYRIGAIQLFKQLSTGTDKELKESDGGNRAGRKKISIKILTPTNDLVRQIIDEMSRGSTSTTDNNFGISSKTSNLIGKKSSVFSPYSSENESDTQHLQIRYLESSPRYNVTTATILVVDRKTSLVMEKIDDSKEEFNEAVGLSTYSTSEPTIASYISIFENFWSQIELYEKLRANEKTADRISEGEYDYRANDITELKNYEYELQEALKRNRKSAEIIKRQLEELQETNLELRRQDKLKDEFFSMISHELKTPLTPIIGWCGALKDSRILGNITSEQRAAVDTIESNAVKLEKMISDMLDVQKLELNEMKFNIEDVNADSIFNKIRKDFKFVMQKKNIQFIIKAEPNLRLKSDESRILQVFSALLYNSVDFVPQVGGKIELTAAESKSGDIVFCVKDNGPGIPKDKHQFLFKKFYQVDTSYKRKHGGTGLGLPISKGIVTALGGKIWVESEEGKGSNFYFSLPKTT